MRVLLIGGTGLLGPHIVRELCALNHEVTVLHTGEHEADLPPQVRHIHSDIAGLPVAGIPGEAVDVAPHVVLFMVPVGEADAQIMMKAFTGVAGRIVGISSMDVYRAYGVLHDTEPGPPEPVPITEDSPLRTRLYPYRENPPRSQDDPKRFLDDYEKILAERIIMGDSRLSGTILRLPMIYGPGDLGHRLFKYIERMDDGRPVILLDEVGACWRGSRGFVENVAHAITLAVVHEEAAARIYNVGDEQALSEAEWVSAIGRAARWNGEIVAVPTGRIPLASNMEQQWVTSTARIRRELGYSDLVPLEEAVARAVEWERANPPDEVDPAQFDYAAEDEILADLERS